MRLILRGDKPSARKYIGFAKARLNDIKNIMNALGLDYMRKPPYRLPDADIVVESRYGADTIWIKAEKVEVCKLTAILTPLGSKQVNFLYKYKFDDNSASQALWINTGGLFLTGNRRYSLHSFHNGIVNTNNLFLNTGDYTISAYAHGDVFDQVFHDSGVINQPTYQVIMDVSSIAPKAALEIIGISPSAPYDCYANGVFLGRLFGTEYRSRIFSITVNVVDTMTMDFVAVSGNIRQVQIRFRKYRCLGTDSQIITVT